jgi:hypothetical protein
MCGFFLFRLLVQGSAPVSLLGSELEFEIFMQLADTGKRLLLPIYGWKFSSISPAAERASQVATTLFAAPRINNLHAIIITISDSAFYHDFSSGTYKTEDSY